MEKESITIYMPFACEIEKDIGGKFVISCPSKPGCFTQGDTIQEAVDNMKEALQLYLEV